MAAIPVRPPGAILFRPMQATDAPAVAALHATNWRANYHDVLSAAYLAGDIGRERSAAWSTRLAEATDREFGIVAEADGDLIGFAYVVGNADPEFGNLLDNLHVMPEAQGRGIGRMLLSRVAKTLASKGWLPTLYLWVYATNAAARRFYQRLGAGEHGQELRDSSDGGRVLACRYAWSDAAGLSREAR